MAESKMGAPVETAVGTRHGDDPVVCSLYLEDQREVP